MKIRIQLFLLFLFIGSTSVYAQRKPCTETCNGGYKHNYSSCIDNAINFGRDLEEMGLEFMGVSVTRSDELEAGNASLRDSQSKYKLISTGTKIENLKTIMRRLTSEIQKTQGYAFTIYLIETDIVNAWTCGGKIFFTTAMYDFCANNDEIACILGHEISHNLLGHISGKLKKYKAASQFGFAGEIAAVFGMFVTSAFGQEDEAHSDLLGVDLAWAAGYRACQSITLWERMAEKSGSYNQLDNFLSSHPHPDKRAECIASHIQSKYSVKCQD